MSKFSKELFTAIVRVMGNNDFDEYMESCAEVTNFICSALLQNNPKMVVELRPFIKDLLIMWNEKFEQSKNSIEPEGCSWILGKEYYFRWEFLSPGIF